MKTKLFFDSLNSRLPSFEKMFLPYRVRRGCAHALHSWGLSFRFKTGRSVDPRIRPLFVMNGFWNDAPFKKEKRLEREFQIFLDSSRSKPNANKKKYQLASFPPFWVVRSIVRDSFYSTMRVVGVVVYLSTFFHRLYLIRKTIRKISK